MSNLAVGQLLRFRCASSSKNLGHGPGIRPHYVIIQLSSIKSPFLSQSYEFKNFLSLQYWLENGLLMELNYMSHS